ncbi:hypothetical protein, partial [Allorhizocola rhizosphaerae]|uniref:hypothetical protein n=1 Tax=Allorhizocola rhizosphaerae TaxID=1872709 RepID=UPI0013C32D40
PADLAHRLKPEPARPIMLNGKGFTLTATLADRQPPPEIRVRVRLVTPLGSSSSSETGRLMPGTHKYELNGCERCRLESLEFVVAYADRNAKIELVIGELRDDSGTVLFDASRGWYPSGVEVNPTAQGIGVSVNVPASNARIYPLVLPRELPMAGSVAPPKELGTSVRYAIADAGRLPLVPRLGRHGLLMDFEYAMNGFSEGGGTTLEVWLTANAPPEVVNRLRAAGLDIVDDHTAQQRRAVLGRQAPAAALRFVVAAAIAWLALGLAGLLVAAAFERNADRLTVLRPQGVGQRLLRRAALGSRLTLLGFAFVWSIVAFGMTWGVAYDILPPFLDRSWPAAQLPFACLVPLALPALIAAVVVCWVSARVSYVEELPS